MKAESRHLLFRYAGYVSVGLWAALSMLFALYFIGLNNGSFILYSFLGFIALGIALSIFRDWQAHVLSISTALIMASAISYSGISRNIVAYSIFAIAALSLIVLSVRHREYALYSLWALALPLLFYAAGINAALLINVAIIGYYLLISVVIAFFANMVAESSNLHIGRKAHAFIMGHRNSICVASLVVALLIFFMPFWPAGERLILGRVPYAVISLPSQNGGLYAISFNASEYQGIENSSMSNLRVLAGSTFLKAYIGQNATYSDSNFTLVFNSSPGIGSAELYFMPPFNSTQEMASDKGFYDAYNSSLKIVSRSAFDALYANSTKLPFGLPNVENMLSGIRNETIVYYVTQRHNSVLNETLPIQPYYAMQSVCSMGMDSKLDLSARSTNKISVFMLGSLSNFTNATSIGVSGASFSYGYFISRFMENDHAHVLNSTNITIRENLSGCDYYVVTSPVATEAKIEENQTYYSYAYRTKVVKVPYVFYGGGLESKSAFLPGSLLYLINKYKYESKSNQ